MDPSPAAPPPEQTPADQPSTEQAPPPEAEAAAPEALPKKKGGCLVKLFLLFLLICLLAVIGLGLGFLEIKQRLSPASTEKKEVVVEIPRGANASEIGRRLEEAGVIRSAEAFRRLVAWRKVGSQLKAGEHVLDPTLSTEEIIDSLIQGRFKLYPFTVPEGLRLTEIAALAAKAGLADEKEFIRLGHDEAFIRSLGLDEKNLEGYLFPETYNFLKGAGTTDLIKAMVARFWEVWKKYEGRAAAQDLTRHEIITLASIIEKETGAAFERPLIAAVFLNRIKKGMRLETDPTVIYGITDFDGNLTRKHLQTHTPYNTYMIDGLPPGPIANPGEASIRAVLEPADVDYIFFVSKNDGTHQFSATLAEHNRAVNKYQRRGRTN